MQLQEVCHVCYGKPHPLLHYQQIIQCKMCKLTAHRSCYLPNLMTNEFICDGCSDNYKSQCYLCQNTGLLKKIGKNYAHPVCLMFSSFIVINQFDNLSFLQVDNPKSGRKSKCLQCGKMTTNVLKCSLKCSKSCHIYCALKNQDASQSKGWKIFYQPTKTSNFQIFDNIMERAIKSKNIFLSKYLNIPKFIKPLPNPVKLSCEQHSSTIIQCHCKEFNEQKNSWVYCDSCCRWQHYECIPMIESEKCKYLQDNSQSYICKGCQDWKQMISSGYVVLLKNLPKLHIYDYIYVHRYIESKRYEVPTQLQVFMFNFPILPGKLYAEIEYRKQLVTELRPKIDISFLQQIIIDNQDNEEAIIKNLMKQKDKIELAWWMTKGKLIRQNKSNSKECFVNIVDDQKPQNTVIKEMIQIINQFQNRFVGGDNFQQIKKIQDLFSEKKEKKKPYQQKQRSINKNQANQEKNDRKDHKTKQNKKNNAQMQKVCQQLTCLLNKFYKQDSKHTLSEIISQLYKLINNPAVQPFQAGLPQIPLVKCILLFDNIKDSENYLISFAELNFLDKEWQKLKQGWSNHTYREKQKQMMRITKLTNHYHQQKIISNKNIQIKRELLYQLSKIEIEKKISNEENQIHEEIQLNMLTHNHKLNIEIIDRLTQQYNQKLYENIDNQNILKSLRTLKITKKILIWIKRLNFTQKNLMSVQKMMEVLKKQVNIQQYPLNFLNSYVQLYHATSNLLKIGEQLRLSSSLCSNLHKSMASANDCLFVKLQKEKNLSSNKTKISNINRYVEYFLKIRSLKINILPDYLQPILKEKFSWLIDKMMGRNIFFETESEYIVVKEWLNIFKIQMNQIKQIISIDQQIQSKLIFLRPNFDNPSMITQLQHILSDSLPIYQSVHLAFRVNKIIMVLNWIDLFKYLLQNMSPKALLMPQYAEFVKKHQKKIDFYQLKEALTVMNQIKFPMCKFYQNVACEVQKGEAIKIKIDKICSLCEWSYEWTPQSKISEDKCDIQECNQLMSEMKKQNYCFQVEAIELQIIVQKYQQTQKKAQLFLIDMNKKSGSQYGSKAMEALIQLLTNFGCFPFKSKLVQQLYELMSLLNNDFVFENEIEETIETMEKYKNHYAFHQIQRLLERIEMQILNKDKKQNLSQRVNRYLDPMRKLAKQYEDILQKYNLQKGVFHPVELKRINILLNIYKSHQLMHEDISRIQKNMDNYKFIILSQKWMKDERQKDNFKINDYLRLIEGLHPNYQTNEIKQYQNFLQKLMKQNLMNSDGGNRFNLKRSMAKQINK